MSLREFFEENPDIWKVDNTNPDEGFAVNMDVSLQDLIVLPEEAASESVEGIDDYGRSVVEIPLHSTARRASLHILNCSIELPFDDRVVPIGRFLWHIGTLVREACDDPAHFGLDVEPGPGYFEILRVQRIVWLPGDDDWTIQFNDDAYDR